jgi:cytochrome c biogenesis protein CcmG/thiol:disulfide interchange protein DsbE
MLSEAARAMPRRRSLLVIVPLLIFGALIALFLLRLGAGDPSRLPSALIGKPAPALTLPPLEALVHNGVRVAGIEPSTFRGGVSVVNVWASWCVPCRDEHPFLMKLAADESVRMVGSNYKDSADNARGFLERYGNPFDAVGVDANGRAAIEWGVYGVPETFVVRPDGTIAYKHIGPIDAAGLKRISAEIERASGL